MKEAGPKVPFYHERRGGIRVEDLINRFKSEAKFDTMSKSKKKNRKREEQSGQLPVNGHARRLSEN